MKYYVAGHQGMVGSAIVRRLQSRKRMDDPLDIITCSRRDLDLTDQTSVRNFFSKERPDIVILAAARVGGIQANNNFPAEFIYENLMIECNIIHASYLSGVKKLLNLGSSCIYPRAAEQPMAENALLTGPLEVTNEPYAVAKIAGIKLCESYNRQFGTDYRSVMPTNLYGPGDNFHATDSHVVPALIRRFYEATREDRDEVVLWGSGNPRREFLHVDDMADASLFVLDLPVKDYQDRTTPTQSHINVGMGSDIAIIELAKIIAKIAQFNGRIVTDPSKPDGPIRKLMDSSRLEDMGWKAKIGLKAGLEQTYLWFVKNRSAVRN